MVAELKLKYWINSEKQQVGNFTSVYLNAIRTIEVGFYGREKILLNK